MAEARPVSLKLAFGIWALDDPASAEDALATAESEARAAEAASLAPESRERRHDAPPASPGRASWPT